MKEQRSDWGHFEFTIKEYLEKHQISKNKFSKIAELQYSQLQAYYENQIQRPDLSVLSRICYVLECDLSDILHYIPPQQ